MRNGVIVWCLCVGVGSQSARLAAQEPDLRSPLALGMRLRVTAVEPAPKRIVGTLTAADPHFLTILTSKRSVAIPRETIQTVQISERRSWKRKGALIGAGVGAVAAVILAATDKQEPFLFSDEPLFTRGEIGLIGAILFVPAGAGLGALVAPGERWVAVPAAARGAAHRENRRGALQFGVRIRF